MATKHLALLRHAKSSWNDPQLADHDRPLAPRGQRAAARIGEYMREKGIRPDLVLCSSAVRTQQTLALLGLPPTTETLIEDELYGAPAAALMARLRKVDADPKSVLLIAHNPGIHDAAVDMAIDPDRRLGEFPTAALADLRMPIASWADLTQGIGRLKDFVVPRNLT